MDGRKKAWRKKGSERRIDERMNERSKEGKRGGKLRRDRRTGGAVQVAVRPANIT